MRSLIIGVAALACSLTAVAQDRPGSTAAILGGRPLLHAHN